MYLASCSEPGSWVKSIFNELKSTFSFGESKSQSWLILGGSRNNKAKNTQAGILRGWKGTCMAKFLWWHFMLLLVLTGNQSSCLSLQSTGVHHIPCHHHPPARQWPNSASEAEVWKGGIVELGWNFVFCPRFNSWLIQRQPPVYKVVCLPWRLSPALSGFNSIPALQCCEGFEGERM